MTNTRFVNTVVTYVLVNYYQELSFHCKMRRELVVSR